MFIFATLLMICLPAILFATADPGASCTALSVQEGETASIMFFFNGILNRSMKYFLSIRKDDGKDHIFSCYQLYGSEGSCTISTTDIQLDYRLRDENLTLTFPSASREDGGLYTLEMHVNDAKLNTTSCTLNVQERSEHSVILTTIGYETTSVHASSGHSPISTTIGYEMTLMTASSGSSNHDADSKMIIAVIVSVIIVAIIIAAGYILWKKPYIRRWICNRCGRHALETDGNNGNDPATSQPMLRQRDSSNNPHGAESNSNLPGQEVNPNSRDQALSGRLTPIGQSCLDDDEKEEAGETTGVDGPRPGACGEDGQPTPAPPQTFYGDDEGEPFELLTPDARTGSSENEAGGSYSWGCSFQ